MARLLLSTINRKSNRGKTFSRAFLVLVGLSLSWLFALSYSNGWPGYLIAPNNGRYDDAQVNPGTGNEEDSVWGDDPYWQAIQGKKGSLNNGSGKVPTNGVLYVLSTLSPDIPYYKEIGRWKDEASRFERYLQEFNRSLSSLRATNPDQHVTLITDRSDRVPKSLTNMLNVTLEFPSNINITTEWGDKDVAMLMTPYNNTLFLDLDTEICSSLEYHFSALDYADMVFVHETIFKKHFFEDDEPLTNKLDHMLEVNTGVVGYKLNARTIPFYLDLYHTHSQQRGSDQGFYNQCFQKSLLYKHKVVGLSLPVEYNFRFSEGRLPIFMRGPAKVIHSRYTTCAKVNRKLMPNSFKMFNGMNGEDVLYIKPGGVNSKTGRPSTLEYEFVG